MKHLLLLIILDCVSLLAARASADWHVVRSHPQKHFLNTIPPGNYSGIANMGGDVYAMVSDKSDSVLYFNVRLYISRQTGELLQAEYMGSKGRVDAAGLDNEAIAKVSDSTIVVASEQCFRLKEYLIDENGREAMGEADGNEKTAEAEGKRNVADGKAQPRLWEWSMPEKEFWPNYGFESLAYDSIGRKLWTINESTMRRDGKAATPQDPHKNVLRLMSFNRDDLTAAPVAYLYRMDMPTTMKAAQTYAMGVSELCALPDGQLLVLEREAFVPKTKLGAFCQCKLYVVNPSAEKPYPLEKSVEADAPYVSKRLLTSWRTSITLFSQNWANYEGMCLGPRLENGDQVVVLVSDSQDGYAGLLRDWFKTIVISNFEF